MGMILKTRDMFFLHQWSFIWWSLWIPSDCTVLIINYFNDTVGLNSPSASLWKFLRLLRGSQYFCLNVGVVHQSLRISPSPYLTESFFIGEVLELSDHFHDPLDSHQKVRILLMLPWVPELNTVLQIGFHNSGAGGRITSFNLLSVLLLMQLKSRLSFWAENTHCQFMSSFSSTNTSQSFSSGLLSIYSSPSLYACLGSLLPRCRTFHSDLLNCMLFAQAHFSACKDLQDVIPSLQHDNCTIQVANRYVK